MKELQDHQAISATSTMLSPPKVTLHNRAENSSLMDIVSCLMRFQIPDALYFASFFWLLSLPTVALSLLLVGAARFPRQLSDSLSFHRTNTVNASGSKAVRKTILHDMLVLSAT